MTVERFEEEKKEVIENAEMLIDEEYGKKDLRKRRGYNKEHFYGGSKKQKHVLVKKR